MTVAWSQGSKPLISYWMDWSPAKRNAGRPGHTYTDWAIAAPENWILFIVHKLPEMQSVSKADSLLPRAWESSLNTVQCAMSSQDKVLLYNRKWWRIVHSTLIRKWSIFLNLKRNRLRSFIYLIFEMFSDSVSCSQYTVSKGRSLANNELEKVAKGIDRGLIWGPTHRHLPGGTEEIREKLQLWQPLCRPRFEHKCFE
jgi:hypothetical protein